MYVKDKTPYYKKVSYLLFNTVFKLTIVKYPITCDNNKIIN